MLFPTVDRTSSIPVSTQIADWYRAKVEDGTIETGSNLPSMRSIAKATGISSTTVKRAIDTLHQAGYTEKDEVGRYILRVPALKQNTSKPQQTRWQVFWSYAREDDKNSHGAISTLMQQVRDEFAFMTGDELSDFQDTKDIPWGSNWTQVIEENVHATVFFIPILTPTYFRRPNCIREFGAALANLTEAGIQDGIFPLRFADFDATLDRLVDQRLREYVKTCQYIDCSEVRRLSPSDGRYTAKIGEIVDKMLELGPKLNDDQEKLDALALQEGTLRDEPGALEMLEELESAPDEIGATAEEITADLTEIGSKFSLAAGEMNNQPPSKHVIAARIRICKQLAANLDVPTKRFSRNCSTFVNHVYQLDSSLRAIPMLLEMNPNKEDERMGLEAFRKMISDLQESSISMFEELRDFREATDKIYGLSRDLKPILSSLKESVGLILSLEPVFDSWSGLIA